MEFRILGPLDVARRTRTRLHVSPVLHAGERDRPVDFPVVGERIDVVLGGDALESRTPLSEEGFVRVGEVDWRAGADRGLFFHQP
jgi:hypothetical protein